MVSWWSEFQKPSGNLCTTKNIKDVWGSIEKAHTHSTFYANLQFSRL